MKEISRSRLRASKELRYSRRFTVSAILGEIVEVAMDLELDTQYEPKYYLYDWLNKVCSFYNIGS